MGTIDQQLANQIANIEKATSHSLAEWIGIVKASGLEKHGQILALLKDQHGLSHGNANILAIRAREAAAGGAQSSCAKRTKRLARRADRALLALATPE